MKNKLLFFLFVFPIIFAIFLNGQDKKEAINLLSLQEGTIPVITPDSYGGWPAEAVLDDSPNTGWACESEQTKENFFVFEMVEPALIEEFEFDNASVDTDGSSAKEITIEISSKNKDAGYETVLKTTLADRKDNQKFKPAKLKTGRWIRLTIHNNYGSESYTELMSLRGYGIKPTITEHLKDISGTYETDFSTFHVRQQGTSLVGCYEYSEGLLDGAIEGRVMKITWKEGQKTGPAVMVFTSDGKSFRGYWWQKGNEKVEPSGNWDGRKISDKIGGCPHWSGSLGGELKKQLNNQGRARVYGILFDLNSAVIRSESKPVLDEVLEMLKIETSWKLTIEGHTDSSGNESYNQTLSLKRAEAVKTYLVAHGIDETKLQAKGFGSSKPVAENSSGLGRAQNRRVELVK